MSSDEEKQARARQNLERKLRFRESKALEHGQQLLFHYALRCLCQRCGRLMNWDAEEGQAILQGECCGMLYRLFPRSVAVTVEDISNRPVLPSIDGSGFGDPDADISGLVIGNIDGMITKTQRGLTDAQKKLRFGKKPS